MKKWTIVLLTLSLVLVAGLSLAGPKVALETTKGKIVLELNEEKAPITVKNFLAYVDKGHYDGLIFHRVIKGFMIQGGGMDKDLTPRKTMASIKNEADNGLKNARGTISMARTMVPDSATSQFFINTVDNGNLDFTEKTQRGWGYAVFGKVVEGMDVVDAIEGTRTGMVNRFRDVPLETITITKAYLLK